jgi:heme exporter protein CcmB
MLQFIYYEIRISVLSIWWTTLLLSLYITFIPLFIGLSQPLLLYHRMGLFWVCILFSVLTERLFQQDLDDGTFELYLLSDFSIQRIICCKLLVYWCTKMLGIILTIPFLSSLYQIEVSLMFLLTLFVGCLILTLIYATYSCGTLGSKGLEESWISIQHIAILPVLSPLIILFTNIQTEFSTGHLFILIGYLGSYICICWFLIPTILFHIMSR